MRIGILETGAPPGPLAARFGRFDAMVARMLGPGFSCRTYRVEAGDLPAGPGECDAYVVTGSSAGVYEPLPWIAPLRRFLRDAADARVGLVGLCFGHQVMAEAFGGRVEKAAVGRGMGLHRYEVAVAAPWMDEPHPVAVAVDHGDQVVAAPPGALVLAGSAFTPNAMLLYRGGTAMSVQCHPEFETDFARALYEAQRTTGNAAAIDAAVASLADPSDRERLAGWIREFLRGLATTAPG